MWPLPCHDNRLFDAPEMDARILEPDDATSPHIASINRIIDKTLWWTSNFTFVDSPVSMHAFAIC